MRPQLLALLLLLALPATAPAAERVEVNGETLFEGGDPALAEALFSTWLGDSPLKAGFRDDLLGRR